MFSGKCKCLHTAHGKILIDILCFSVKVERRTRGHAITLTKKQCRLDIIKKKFFHKEQTVNEWNRLSADYVGASSVNILKNKIDIYLRRAGFI